MPWQKLAAEAAVILGEASRTAVYASAGADTKGLSFLHPGFLARRRLPVEAAPNVFFHVDRVARWEDFEDDETSIRAVERTEVGHGVTRIVVRYRSQEFGGRRLVVHLLQRENIAVAAAMHQARFVADHFIGVCDGCSFGGNRDCVNDLSRDPGPAGRLVALPRYWTTDHFKPALEGQLATGECVTSPVAGFPVRFRKLGLLSSKWGTYGPSGTLGGATLFAVERLP